MGWRPTFGLGVIAFAVVMIAPRALLAQSTTSTNCYMTGTTEHCDSQTTVPPSNSGAKIDWGLAKPAPDFVGSYANGYALGRERRAEREAAEERQAQEASAEATYRAELNASAAAWHEEQDRKVRAINAGKLIEAGHCDEARTTALNAGDLDLAAKVAALCPPK